MSNKTRKGSFHQGVCLDMLCNKKGPHYHVSNSINEYKVGPNTSPNLNQAAMLNAYVGINMKRAKRENMKNTIKSWRNRNRKLARQSLKNNTRRRRV